MDYKKLMTLELVDLLKAELETLFAGVILKNPKNEDVPINIFAQSLPMKVSDVERYPSIVIRAERGEDTGDLDTNKVSITFVIGLFDEDNDLQGDRGVMSLIEDIKKHLFEKVDFGKYRIITPFSWMLDDEDEHPFYFGGIEARFEYPKEITTTGNQLNVFAVKELKVYKVLTDDSSEITYDTGKVIPGLTRLAFTPILNSYEHEYSNKIAAMVGKYSGADWSIDADITDFEVMALLKGESFTGKTSPMIFKSTIKASSKPISFKIEAKVKYLNSDNAISAQDMHIVIPKCQINTGSESSFNDNSYLNMGLSGKAYVPEYGGRNSVIREIKTYNEDTALSV